MVLEEEQRCSNSSSGGGRNSKKLKQKKVPQRGLGVAQLEKIRLEEQQKKKVSTFDHLPGQSSSISFPLPCSTNLSSSNPLFRSPPPISFSNFDFYIPPPPPPPPPSLPTTTFYPYNSFNPPEGNGNGARNFCELVGEGSKSDPSFASCYNVQNDRNSSTWSSMNTERKQQQQAPPSSMVNVSVSTSSTSSGLNFQMEPPSNQSCRSNYITSHLWPEEEKMVGMKRPWPFSLDNPGPLFQFPQFNPQICRLDESSSVTGGVFNFEPGNAIFREGLSNSAPTHVERREISSELNSKKGTKEIGALDGKFLTLGLPPTGSSSKSSKAKQPLLFPPSHLREFAEFNVSPYQVYSEGPFFGSNGTVQQHQPFYSFFPQKGQQIGRLTSKSNDQRGKVGDELDLNLSL